MKDFIIEAVRATGAWGVGLLMLLENVFPPIPSELIMPLGGYLSATGDLDFRLVVALGTIGSVLGAIFWYVVGRRLGKERLKAWAGRHGAWVAMTPAEIDRANAWFERHGGVSVMLCRMLPFVRTVISVPAGIAHMRFVPFLVYSTAGTFVWTAGLAWGGRLLGSRFESLGDVLGWVTWGVLAAATAWYLWRVVRVHRAHNGARAS